MLSAIVVFVGLSFLIIVHELGHFGVAKYFNILVEEFGLGFPPRLLKKKIGETVYSINALPLGGFVKLHGEILPPKNSHPVSDERAFINQKAGKKALVIIAGCLMNFLAGWLIISAVFWLGSPSIIIIESVAKNSPAETAGLKTGDIIRWEETAESFNQFINAHKGKNVDLKIQRERSGFDIAIVPRLESPQGEGPLGLALRSGGVPRHGFFAGLYRGLVTSFLVVGGIFLGLYQIFLAPEMIVGPVGVFNIAVSTGNLGLVYVLQLLGFISLNLMVLNILPIPALDGGRLLFIILEKIRGKAFSPQAEMKANAIGFIVLISLIILITIKDISVLF